MIQHSVLQDALRSDHTPFWFNAYPAVMINDGGNFRNPNYHCAGGADSPSTIDHSFAQQVTEVTVHGALQALDE